jgi:phosphoserine phosphatase
MRPTSILATVTGRDRRGVTAAFFAALAAHDIDVRDVEQVVIRDRLILTVLFDLHGDTGALRNSVTATAGALGMECEIAIADTDDAKPAQPDGEPHYVIVLGHPLRPGAMGHVAQRIADTGSNIETVTQVSAAPGLALEMLVRTPDAAGLRSVLVGAAEDAGVDLAVEAGALRRCAKRLVLLDLDAMSVRTDPIGLLAEQAGAAAQAAAVAARAAAGELSRAEALRERVALLDGLSEAVVAEVGAQRQVPDALRAFVGALRRSGYRIGLVCDGVTAFTDPLAAELDLDFAVANQLEISDGRLTGRLSGAVLDRRRKAAALARFAERVGVPMSQTVAVGCGADDIDMIGSAGLGIAFNGKSALRVSPDASAHYLDSVLFVLGVGSELAAGA